MTGIRWWPKWAPDCLLLAFESSGNRGHSYEGFLLLTKWSLELSGHIAT